MGYNWMISANHITHWLLGEVDRQLHFFHSLVMPNPDSIQKGWQYWVKFGDLLVSFYLGWTPPFSLGRALSSTLMFGSDHAIRDREDVIFWTCGGCFAHENSATFATWRLGLFWGSVQEEGKPHDSWFWRVKTWDPQTGFWSLSCGVQVISIWSTYLF